MVGRQTGGYSMSTMVSDDVVALQADDEARTVRAMKIVARLESLAIRSPFPAADIRALSEELATVCGPE